MAKAPAQTKVVKAKKGDVQVKGKKTSGKKKTNQGNSKNTKYTTKNRSRDKKGKK